MQIIFVLTTSYYYLAHCPEQTHNSVHANPCVPHLQRPLQDFLQLHLISSFHAPGASGSSQADTSTKERILSQTSSIPIQPMKLTSAVFTNWPVTLLCKRCSQCSVHHLQTGFVELRSPSRYYILDCKVLWSTSLQFYSIGHVFLMEQDISQASEMW